MKSILTALLAGTLLCSPLAAQDADGASKPLPSAHNYEPQDDLERGLWYEMDEAERWLKQSKFLIEDPELNDYVRGVLCRTVGDDRCAATRLYIVRTPYFNASMAPNGVMLVYSGLLLRMRSEAQLAAVLGHEFTHFEKQHSLRLFRNMRSKTDLLSWLYVVPVRVPYAAAVGTQMAIMGSLFSFGRDMEREADAGSVTELARAGYDPRAASAIWSQLGAEMDATAKERGHRSDKNRNGGLFATHPRSTERMGTLAKLAQEAQVEGKGIDNAAEYRAALANWWPRLIEDQIALKDFGGTEYLLATLAGTDPLGWTGDLLYARGELYRARGEAGDFAQAAEFFRQAIAAGNAPSESWRGLGLSLLRDGQATEGKAALRQYLELAPDAPDAALLASMAGEEIQ
ncbi:M48 family metalloprotease [Altererythrobacter arenosus]|uniref:M48 family metalloprotease n=1 Tax=Altererythrobacter arenosus TaxID=3032592 RepID=A0ABY8FST0_9SPHN|nr:M48 family metallopeptidase [Altererythrobacter sp. CAU 1644]WFL78072.1 M48 family metalloprotease [Altererythrobacter sp. CAU 1644]